MSTSTTVTPVIITDAASISGFNRGPITTLFAAPPSCTATVSIVDRASAYYVGHYGSYYDPECYPSNEAGKPASNWDKYYYSPAICPSGWSIATSFPSLVPAAPPRTSYTINSDTTAALCCPSGYVYYTMGHQCTSTVPAGQDLTVNSYSLNGMTFAPSLKTIPQISKTVVVNDGIPIMWQASDSAVLARASTMSSTPDATASITPVGSSPAPDTSQSSGGLSTGAKVGLGVGIPVAVIALLAMGFLLWRRRQKSRPVPELDTAQQQHTGYKDAPAQGYYPQGDYPQGNYQQENYHQGQPHYEMHTSPVERHNPQELPATRH